MNALKIFDLFDKDLLTQIDFWLDTESPYYDDDTWQPDGPKVYSLSNSYTNTLHKVLLDKARDIFQIHNLLPSVSYLKWIEEGHSKDNSHIDKGPEEHTIIYNYFSEGDFVFTHESEQFVLENNEAIAYSGASFFHHIEQTKGAAIVFYFSFASSDNPYFKFGQYNKDGYITYPSGEKHGYSQ